MAGGIKETSTVGIMLAITALLLLLLAAAAAGRPSSGLPPLPAPPAMTVVEPPHQGLVAGSTPRLGSVVTKAVVGEQQVLTRMRPPPSTPSGRTNRSSDGTRG
uniref:Uncharacterized protein n=1 Tax=Saccharum hybrid cultivar R570 TaxID=131158 RepID=A0A059Q3D4_9POAL|nr:hypothetical protein SHCRBa_176_L06_R_140 [Saccharum hybrid cultivar R570]